MLSTSSSARVAIAFSVILFSTVSANASSFSINIIGQFNINLAATGFSMTATGQTSVSGVPGHGFSGPPGSVINLNATPFLDPTDFNFGFVNLNGTNYQIFPGFFPPPGQVAVQFSMNVTGGSITIPIGSTDPTLVLTAPISHTLGVRGNGFPFPTVVFSNGYYGEGTYTITLSRQPSGDYAMQSVNYQFGLAPIPEPATLILFGSGMLGVVGTRLRKRQ